MVSKVSITHFIGGSIRHHLHMWETLTSDLEILTTVVGLKIEFEDIPKTQGNFVKEYVSNKNDTIYLNNEINKLLLSKVVAYCEEDTGQSDTREIRQHTSYDFKSEVLK